LKQHKCSRFFCPYARSGQRAISRTGKRRNAYQSRPVNSAPISGSPAIYTTDRFAFGALGLSQLARMTLSRHAGPQHRDESAGHYRAESRSAPGMPAKQILAQVQISDFDIPEDPMELRLLTSDAEKSAFARNLAETRACKGAGFAETPRSLVGQVHLAFGELYALYDDCGDDPARMLAGFAIHDLASFPQSHPKPDLSHLPPESVFECGELWAAAAGGAQLARHAGFILASIRKADALLVYPLFKPWNLSFVYKGFERASEPVQWPYIKTLGGEKMFVQPMVLAGEALHNATEAARSCGYELLDGQWRIRFNSPFPMCSKQLPRRQCDWNEATASQPLLSAA
jgi:hypothetical protein